MQHIDDNMDELFRKAADDYPLKINVGRWDDVFPLVDLVPPVVIAVKKRRSPFAIIAVLFFSVAGILVATNWFINSNHKQLAAKKTEAPSSPNNTNTKATTTIVANRKLTESITLPEEELKTRDVKNKRISDFARNNNINSKWESVNNSTKAMQAMQAVLPQISFERVSPAFIHPALLNKLADTTVVIQKNAATVSLNKLANKASRFYFGLEGGVQWNEVKGQGFNKAGLSGGVLAGLQINKNLSVETGIGWSQKHFFTDGKYFNMSKAVSSMPSNMQVMSMSSCSNLLEIPVKFNYTIIHKKSSNWFLTAGISSYILTKESNHYLAVINGQEQNAAGEYIAKRNYFSAVAQLGVGYQYKASKQIKLRIEPYLQIPLKGIGIGEVQVMTAGLHLALLRSTRN